VVMVENEGFHIQPDEWWGEICSGVFFGAMKCRGGAADNLGQGLAGWELISGRERFREEKRGGSGMEDSDGEEPLSKTV
jgi:hypothetical protein